MAHWSGEMGSACCTMLFNLLPETRLVSSPAGLEQSCYSLRTAAGRADLPRGAKHNMLERPRPG